MQLFYAPELTTTPRLPAEEAKHCMKILRHQIGDHIMVTNGSGFFYKCEIIDNGGNLKVLTSTPQLKERDYFLHLAIAPTKSGERTDWMIEKLVEFGVDELTFLQCAHNERNKINLERCERVAIAAMKQSIKATTVTINDIIPFSQFIKTTNAETKLLAHCNALVQRTELNAWKATGSILCCIGPEGDFSEAEIEEAAQNGFAGISMGLSRLRTETAAIAACSYFYFNQ